MKILLFLYVIFILTYILWKTIFNIFQFQADISHKYTSILDISVSFNGEHIVLFTNGGYCWLGSSNFTRKYCEVDTGIFHKPKQLMWYTFVFHITIVLYLS